MDENEELIVFETDDGSLLEFQVVYEFYRDGSKFAVLKPSNGSDEALIAEVSDPLGPDEEYIPLPLNRQKTLLDYLNEGNFDSD